ncbi:MAG: DUF547 domain-containing protein [Owenweeksia sp.]
MKLKIIAGFMFCTLVSGAQNSLWNELLQKHVNEKGWVDYEGFQGDEPRLDEYLQWLDDQKPEQLGEDAAKALWINAYNAYTVKLILDHYPIKSIKDIGKGGKDAWSFPFAKVGGKTYTLNQIEHDKLLRKYQDYRIHAGVNCASYSCPALLNEAFTAARVDAQLEKAFADFVNDPLRNRIGENQLELSAIFKWFADDFKVAGGVEKVIRKYSRIKVAANPQINFRDYNWKLNTRPD